MSAWIVSKGHIDCLVQELAVQGLIEWSQTEKIGKELWSENHRSVNARYGESTRRPPYEFHGIEAPLDPVIVLTQVLCYDYQTCEHDGWPKSRSYRLMTALTEKLLADLGLPDTKAFYADPRWGRSPWGIEHIGQAVQSITRTTSSDPGAARGTPTAATP